MITELLYRYVEQTIEHDLPEHVDYLQAYDRFARDVQEIATCPPRRSALTDQEAERVEALYRASFDDKQPTATT